jgi:hypothetical protein
MTSETAPRKRQSHDPLDATDRKLLALLTEGATRTYAELGRLLHLSAPAVHERAKRLKAATGEARKSRRSAVFFPSPRLPRQL